ncbi:hypothetical protein [uncultured Prevotella sp.]|uniref:hypothetical protein n=1 Tax=uncultured Prevotella sp. TaxID=159272 RepID=UPI0025865505|nr:hypothetical protein [uncultured Prevotella sp.]
MKKNYNKIICAICVVCGLTSCSDFLDIKPQNEIISMSWLDATLLSRTMASESV